MILREIRSATLENIQDDALDVEGNMASSCNMKHMKYFEKKKPKDEAGTSNKNKENQDEKIEEMTRILRGFPNKLTILKHGYFYSGLELLHGVIGFAKSAMLTRRDRYPSFLMYLSFKI